MLYSVVINSVLVNPLCVWIAFIHLHLETFEYFQGKDVRGRRWRKKAGRKEGEGGGGVL